MIKQRLLGGPATVLAVLFRSILLRNSTFAAKGTGSGPPDSLVPNGKAMALAHGHHLWYSFQYAGNGLPIQVWVNELRHGCVAFSLWTTWQVQQLEAGSHVAPIGHGTPSVGHYPGELSWVGSFEEKGIYYLKVENIGTETTTFTVQVEGEGVILPET